MLKRSTNAFDFAALLATEFQGKLSSKVRAAAVAGDEHKALASDVRRLLEAHLESKSHTDVIFDWEGNTRPSGTQQHSYPLFGTYAHPDAAVLSPFTCAIEFDREPGDRPDWSHFKVSLMKAACHVLSRAYDASLFVYTLRRADSSASAYLSDESSHTRELLATLRASGMVVAIVPTR
ncbi:MAG: hypothetical protein U0263_01495 [Polyangiaceae bacterium]